MGNLRGGDGVTSLSNSLREDALGSCGRCTSSGIPVKSVYGADDLAQLDPAEDLGKPGDYPFTRGIHPEMYRKRLWTFRQLSGFATARASNERFKYLLDRGVTALSVCFDMPTKMGRDSDDIASEGEVGRGGVAVDSIADVEALFEGIPLDQTSTNLVTNAQSAILLAFYIVVAEKRGISAHQLRGTTQNDMLKEFIAEKSYVFRPGGALRLAMDTVQYSILHLPKWNPISISGYHIAEAGATPVQELAFCFANALTYVEALLQRGLQVDEFAPGLSFFFRSGSDLFEEVSKFRAARRLWARLLRERYGAKDPRSWLLRFHAQTSGASLTFQQPQNNIIRSTLQALAAVLGGAQSLHINAYDEALSLPSEQAALTAIRTHQIIAFETGVTASADPLGGSYYVESLTNEIEDRVLGYMQRIENLGGVIAALEEGFFEREIAKAAYASQQEIERGNKILVGVNQFHIDDEPAPPESFDIDEGEEQCQLHRLAEIKRSRDGAAVVRSLERIREAARGSENLLPYILDAARVYATLGEITDSLSSVFGRYREGASVHI